MTAELKLLESVAGSGKTVGKKWRARIIEGDRWGSSAYYPADVLERDGARVFTKGLQMYRNHPKESDTWERPERDIDDLVGHLASDAAFGDEGEGPGLYADVEFHESFVSRINELHEDVGLSVRATGLTEDAEMDGRFGPVLVGLLAADSVDVVTKAGAGGKLTSILESDRSPAGRPIETKGTQSVTDVTKEDFDQLKTELVEAINSIPGALAESLKAAAEPVVEAVEVKKPEVKDEHQEEDAEVDTVVVATAVTEAELPATAIALVVADVKAGKSLEEAVKAQTDYRDALVAKANVNGNVTRFTESDKTTGLARAVAKLNG